MKGVQGDRVRYLGSDAFILCPKCGQDWVVYNGNYFCDQWGENCDWALAHPAVTKKDRKFCDEVGIDYN
jgi:hypothetical protein